LTDLANLAVDDVVDIHDVVLEELGAKASPRLHRDKLESTINRPRHLAHYTGADVIAQAVSLAVGIPRHRRSWMETSEPREAPRRCF
jgi:hypothetical protein